MSDIMLEVKNLSVQYKTDLTTVYAVDDVSFTLERGKTIGLVGETGAGKTTIAKTLMQILPSRTARITGGDITLNGEKLLKAVMAAGQKLSANVSWVNVLETMYFGL